MATEDQFVECTYTLPYPPDLVWHFVRDFFGVQRIFPDLVKKCALKDGVEPTLGSTRDIEYQEGSVFHEQLNVRDDKRKLMSYKIVESSPTQIGKNYEASYVVRPISKPGHSFWRYQATFNGTSEEVNAARVFNEILSHAFEDRLAKAVEDKVTPPNHGANELKDDEVGVRYNSIGVVLPYPIETVWSVVTRFSALDKFFPDLFKTCENLNGKPETEVGVTRRFELADGNVGIERLTKYDDKRHSFQYVFDEAAEFKMPEFEADWECSSLNEGKDTYLSALAKWKGPGSSVAMTASVYEGLFAGVERTLKEEAA